MTSRSSFDSKIGLTICSPHCSARLEATREPRHSNWVATGSRYMSSLRPACTASDAQVVGCGSATTSSSSAFKPFSDSGMRVIAVAGVALHEHRLQIVFLGDLVLRQDRRIEPARERDAGRLHDLLGRRNGRLQIVVVDLPDARPMLPRAFDEAVVERQRHDIEADVGGALHVVVAAEDVGAHAGTADIAGEQQQHAARAHVGGADRVLGLAHAPDQRRRLLRSRTSGRRA